MHNNELNLWKHYALKIVTILQTFWGSQKKDVSPRINNGVGGDGVRDRNWVGEKMFLREDMCLQGCIMAKEEMGSEKRCSLGRRWAQEENIPP